MSFGLFSLPIVLSGIAAISAALWLLQRLRVQHREVEVVTGLFWKAATEETRARVFTKRFRHWWAWLLLSGIGSLLWMLLCQPQLSGSADTRHVVLLDWSVDDADVRANDLELAIETASKLPNSQRTLAASGLAFETLAGPGEPLKMAAIRSEGVPAQQPFSIDSAIASLVSQCQPDGKLIVHLIGDAAINQKRIGNYDETRFQLVRIPRKQSAADQEGLLAFGVSAAKSGAWDLVDVQLEINGKADERKFDPQKMTLTLNDQLLSTPLKPVGGNRYELIDLAANGQSLHVSVDEKTIGRLTLPQRKRIRISRNGDVPAVLEQLIELDPSCEFVEDNADISIGTGDDCDLQLTSGDVPAFQLFSETEQPQAALNDLVDELALRQIDATAIAEKSGQVIDVQFQASDKRRLCIWGSLFSPTFDFRESRACPLIVSRSIRWLAEQPELVEWAVAGERLPAAATILRSGTEFTTTADGRQLQTTRLLSSANADADSSNDAAAGLPKGTPFTWLGILLACLMTFEWVFFQKGRLP